MTANVLGLDTGLANAGAARITIDGRVDTWHLETPTLDDPTPGDTADRIRTVVRWCVGRASTDTVLAVVEELPHATEFGQHDVRAAILWGVVGQLHRHGLLVALVNPTSMKARITGNGRADKTLVRSAVRQLYPRQGLDRIGPDQADAVGLATLGVCRLAEIRGEPWRGPWLGQRSLNLEAGFTWPRELRVDPTTRPRQLPMYEVFSHR